MSRTGSLQFVLSSPCIFHQLTKSTLMSLETMTDQVLVMYESSHVSQRSRIVHFNGYLSLGIQFHQLFSNDMVTFKEHFTLLRAFDYL